MKVSPHFLILFASFFSVLAAAEDVVLQWQFDGASEAGEWQGKKGKAKDAEAGPRAPRYPNFDAKNQAGLFQGNGGFLVVKDKERGGAANIALASGRPSRSRAG